MIHYEFRIMVLLADIEPINFGGHNHLVSAVQRQGIRNKDGYTPTTTVKEIILKENKCQESKKKLDMDQYITTTNSVSNKPLAGHFKSVQFSYFSTMY